LGKAIKFYKYYAFIYVKKRFKRDVLVPIKCDLIQKVNLHYVWFNITKEEFTKEEKRIRIIREEQLKFPGVMPEKSTADHFLPLLDPTGFAHRKKERKR
jgi:hypothetical protein